MADFHLGVNFINDGRCSFFVLFIKLNNMHEVLLAEGSLFKCWIYGISFDFHSLIETNQLWSHLSKTILLTVFFTAKIADAV